MKREREHLPPDHDGVRPRYWTLSREDRERKAQRLLRMIERGMRVARAAHWAKLPRDEAERIYERWLAKQPVGPQGERSKRRVGL